VLSFINEQAKNARVVLSVCTGALICGAAGLLKGRRATTHWASFDLLEYFGAIPTKARTVTDGSLITTAGVTAGIDAALQLAAQVCGEPVAQQIQLSIEYAPEPPFNSGTPETAPPAVLARVKSAYEAIQSQRRTSAEETAKRLGVVVHSQTSRI
jgi:cyclohexyl-isocyanide hydratase